MCRGRRHAMMMARRLPCTSSAAFRRAAACVLDRAHDRWQLAMSRIPAGMQYRRGELRHDPGRGRTGTRVRVFRGTTRQAICQASHPASPAGILRVSRAERRSRLATGRRRRRRNAWSGGFAYVVHRSNTASGRKRGTDHSGLSGSSKSAQYHP